MKRFVFTFVFLAFSLVSSAQGGFERMAEELSGTAIAAEGNLLSIQESSLERHLREDRPYYETEDAFNKRTNEIRADIEATKQKIARMKENRARQIEAARERDRQLEEQLREAQRKQQLEQRKRQIAEQQRQKIAAQQQRERELEAQREQARIKREERRLAEERERQIKYERDYNQSMRSTSGYYAQKSSEMSRMASRSAIDRMFSSFDDSRMQMSIEDVRANAPERQSASRTASAERLRNRLAARSQVGHIFEDGFFNDRVFRSLNADVLMGSADLVWQKANRELVQSYWEKLDKSEEPSADYPLAYTEWLYGQFKNLSGYDIKEILQKAYRTDEERQAVLDFNLFSTQLLHEKEKELDSELRDIDSTPEKKVADMAILSAIPYGGNDELLQYTDYKQVDSETAPDEVKDLARMIELCNDDTYGFHAQLFYNDKTRSYTISYEGSSDLNPLTLYDEFKQYLIGKSMDIAGLDKHFLLQPKYSEAFKDWILTNAKQGMYDIPDQFKLIVSIADMIDKVPNVDIQLTGHSLGGGLASFCGLLTGRETTTFNAEGVNMNIIWEGGSEARQRAGAGTNITAYHDRSDLLTKVQKNTPLPKALGKEVIVDVDPQYKKSLFEKRTGHMIVPMAKHFINQKSDSMERWKQISKIKEKYSESFRELSLSSLAGQ